MSEHKLIIAEGGLVDALEKIEKLEKANDIIRERANTEIVAGKETVRQLNGWIEGLRVKVRVRVKVRRRFAS